MLRRPVRWLRKQDRRDPDRHWRAIVIGLPASRGSALSASISRQAQPSCPQRDVSVSLDVVGHTDGVRMTRPSFDHAVLRQIDPAGISSQRRVRFRSGLLWRPERHGRARCRELAVLFLPATARQLVGICWYRQQSTLLCPGQQPDLAVADRGFANQL